jgi:hypothetical protein
MLQFRAIQEKERMIRRFDQGGDVPSYPELDEAYDGGSKEFKQEA